MVLGTRKRKRITKITTTPTRNHQAVLSQFHKQFHPDIMVIQHSPTQMLITVVSTRVAPSTPPSATQPATPLPLVCQTTGSAPFRQLTLGRHFRGKLARD